MTERNKLHDKNAKNNLILLQKQTRAQKIKLKKKEKRDKRDGEEKQRRLCFDDLQGKSWRSLL